MIAPEKTGVPPRVGVLGGGRMGAGIAHAFLVSGAEVVVVERNAAEAAAARARVLASVDAGVARGTMTEDRDAVAARLSADTDDALFGHCGLVLEAVPEDPVLKLESLRRVEAVLAPGAALASNTSSISIDDLAGNLARPETFLGMHFFNPVPASALVEVVRGAATDDALVVRAQGWVRALGKTPVTVNDAPGFASSRLGVAIGLEAIRMLEEGVASAEDIDAAMVLGYRFPIGPLRLTDVVGLDVRLGIAEYLHERLGARFEPPALLRALVAEGQLGRKSGRGFYEWGEG
ncbi:3-hydroxyacyl-CoA dehydrogenase family protein [Klugiella xanthotipulae]|uniref:3-hydroxybutyryl-CoA dehydrogenase n=1 Tax=Klugiella xanthotipulae TaxID=244735 RepID=A0A543HGU7_9MICO|nr:3-hydroxyacyl-CoA dehydrogenase family protein [Klugiella xanthotipulae]TQM57562.1 3-hydroxybutyryl-CoA dehydrogenase [Klugiella xanthotipulae]TQM66425.1 3-hydroxybutyryl-CoA dehydrogenase [Klugiella xanthotipulae]